MQKRFLLWLVLFALTRTTHAQIVHVVDQVTVAFEYKLYIGLNDTALIQTPFTDTRLVEID